MEIYFIDDDVFINKYHQILFGEIAKKRNFDLIFFKNGEEAINHLKGLKASDFPKAIFLDINMPIMNGWEFLEAYDQLENASPRVVILTTSKNPAYEQEAKDSVNVKSYKIKPLESNYFESILDEYST